ncbi:MAG: ATP-binding cassette domain-containing protein, partial [Beijerinckiaceae bacterium]
QLGFGADKADTPVERLSGGEKARLLLGLAAFDGPHLLILDEPTNHLDIPMREALITAIAEYEGAVVIVSHDRFLLDAACDRLWLVADGGVRPFDGDMDEYAALVLSSRRVDRNGDGPSDKNADNGASEVPRPSSSQTIRKIAQAEAQIAKLQALLARVDEALARPQAFRENPAKAGILARDRAALAAKLALAEDDWLRLQE